MAVDFDIVTDSLHISGGRLLPDPPAGYAAMAAPRRAARGREKDTLFLCLALRGREPVPPEQYNALLDLASATFFGSGGSVTSALRQAIQAVNNKLLEGNLAASQPGPRSSGPLQGGLLGAVLRGSDLYAVQSGAGHLLVARPAGHERFPSANTRALGSSNTFESLYFHTVVAAGDYFVFSSIPPRGWTDIALVGLGQMESLAAVGSRLADAAGAEATALIGRIDGASIAAAAPAPAARSQRPRPTPAPETRSAQPAADSSPAEPAPAQPAPAAHRRAAGLAEFFRLRRADPPEPSDPGALAETDAVQAERPQVTWGGASEDTPNPQEAEAPIAVDWPASLRGRQGAPAPEAAEVEAEEDAPPARDAGGLAVPARRGLRAVARAIGVTLSEAVRGLRLLVGRTLPEGALQQDGLFSVPTSVQVGIAILMPLLVVGVSVWLYLEDGRQQQFAAALSEAQWEVVRGRAEPDPLTAAPHWEAALVWLAQADALQPGEAEVSQLRQEAQGHLDTLEWVTRLDYQPLLATGLGRGSQIADILLVGQDVYVLDEGRNRVVRLMVTQGGSYAVDGAFECSGGQTVRDVTVGQIIAMAQVPGPTVIGGDTVLPAGDAVIVAYDSLGALMYCATGLTQPYASYLAAPVLGWLRPVALEMYADRMYVLDPGSSRLWQYQSSGGAFTQEPIPYFASVSYDLQDTVDFSIAGGEVFLLRRDGRVTHCVRQAPGAAPVCIEVAQFSDPRSGRGVSDQLAGVSAPRSLTYNAPPEPSLYLVDGDSSAIYQLSLKLALVRQYRPRFDLPQPISAVAFDASKRFFAAAGDNVYFAVRP